MRKMRKMRKCNSKGMADNFEMKYKNLTDKYKKVTFKCIKGISLSSVQTRTLSEMGFPADVPQQPSMGSIHLVEYCSKLGKSPYPVSGYIESAFVQKLVACDDRDAAILQILSTLKPYGITREELVSGLISSCVYDLSSDVAKELIDEFIFIIERLLPRQLSDLYYSFDFEPNPSYAVFFDIASKIMCIPTYAENTEPRYKQFISHTEDGVKKRINQGESLYSIYANTCATKEIIKNSVYDMPHTTYASIECILLSLSKQYSYIKNEAAPENPIDFSVYKEKEKILNILFLSERELDAIEDLDDYLGSLKLGDMPTLILDAYEYECCDHRFSSVIRKALKEPEFIAVHNEERRESIKHEKLLQEMIVPEEQCGTDTVYCPVIQGQIDGTSCYEITLVADKWIKPSVLPQSIEWNEELRKICNACKYHCEDR